MVIWGWITVLAVLGVIVYLLLHRRTKARLLDPVCGMTVTPARAHATRFGPDGPIYLCSQQCLSTFDAAPGHFGGLTPHRGAHVAC